MKFVAALLLSAGALSACGSAPQFADFKVPQFGGGGGEAPEIQRNAKDGDVELVLHPLSVWDEIGVSDSETIAADGREFLARRRGTSLWEKPFARAGLFWHSRVEHIFMPLVVLGPPAEIRKVEIRAGGSRALLRRARNFEFTPARRSSDAGKVSSAVFEMKPETLRAVAASDTARLVVSTDRGILNLGLDVVAGDSADDYRRNARVAFARFAAKIAAEEKAGG